jgi:hypothetical protein
MIPFWCRIFPFGAASSFLVQIALRRTIPAHGRIRTPHPTVTLTNCFYLLFLIIPAVEAALAQLLRNKRTEPTALELFWTPR